MSNSLFINCPVCGKPFERENRISRSSGLSSPYYAHLRAKRDKAHKEEANKFESELVYSSFLGAAAIANAAMVSLHRITCECDRCTEAQSKNQYYRVVHKRMR